jgi:hypothetical protein
MTGSKEIRQRAIDSVENLPTERLDEAVDLLKNWCLQTNQIVLPAPSKSEESSHGVDVLGSFNQPNSS